MNIPLHYIKLTHQHSYRNINLKSDHTTVGKRVIHGHKHRKEIQLLSLMLIILVLVYRYDIKEVHGNPSNTETS